jgi:hypothetical protein
MNNRSEWHEHPLTTPSGKRLIWKHRHERLPPPAPSEREAQIDVERLGAAIELVRMNWFMLWRSGDHLAIAAKVASEYAALGLDAEPAGAEKS